MPPALTRLDELALRRWAFRARSALGEHRVAIDALNVFPVPDGDTGTNLYQTLHAALESLVGTYLSEGPAGLREDTAALARSILLSARGNSGVILSQLVRGIAESVRRVEPDAGMGPTELAVALRRASECAYEGVNRPVEGTILTVARVAAEAAASAAGRGAPLGEVCGAALEGARGALAATPAQLPSLARAGVVDAGGAGLVVVLDALHEVVTGESVAPPPAARTDVTPADLIGDGPTPAGGPDGGGHDHGAGAYEVMYLVEDGTVEGGDALRAALGRLGESVVVAGDAGLTTVHVHTDEPGAAIEAALGQPGRVYGIRITYLAATPDEAATPGDPHPDPAASRPAGVGVVACASGRGLADLFARAGARVVPDRPGERATPGQILAAVRDLGTVLVVVLPNDDDAQLAAEAAAGVAAEHGIDARVLPTRSPVQGLAAIAVLDPDAGPEDAATAMRDAAAAVRIGTVVPATRRAHTEAGWCEPGDVLGVVGDRVVVVGRDASAVAADVVDRLLADGGELLTLVGGRGHDGLTGDVADQARQVHPELEVSTIDGGQPVYALFVGVE